MWNKLKKRLKHHYADMLSQLQYGRETIAEWTKEHLEQSGCKEASILDIGLGKGTDLLNIRQACGDRYTLHLHGVESYTPYIEEATAGGIEVYDINIEHDPLPIASGSLDVVLINQVLEHAKEWYFIMSEIHRVLKPGGICIIGVPNLVSWHERVRLLFGKHPYCLDMLGPHIRGITLPNLTDFMTQEGYFRVDKSAGSYFYGILNKRLNMMMAKLFPKLCVTVLLQISKAKEGTFHHILDHTFLETNFYRGENSSSQSRKI